MSFLKFGIYVYKSLIKDKYSLKLLKNWSNTFFYFSFHFTPMLGFFDISYFKLEFLVDLTFRSCILHNKQQWSVVWFLKFVCVAGFIFRLCRWNVLLDSAYQYQHFSRQRELKEITVVSIKVDTSRLIFKICMCKCNPNS